ncbi:MAG: phospholipase D family protein [Roseiarcus sp.]
MRYIDSGTRNAADALGGWLEANVLRDRTLRQLRWQSGFFSANSLGYFATAMKRLRPFDGVLRVLIGSNDGSTSLADVCALLAAAGPSRKNQQIGVVKFSNAYFHPKTVHVVRADKSSAAYVGSANLTGSGLSGLHIEAGMLFDTQEGDDPAILAQIGNAIDDWFAGHRKGLNLVATALDLDHLAKVGVLPLHPAPPPAAPPAKPGTPAAPQLKPLVKLPKKTNPPVAPSATGKAPAAPAAAWSKTLTRSDAQRKLSGNQRGSITLVRGGFPIDASSYFRDDFFKAANWKAEKTVTGEKRETALVRFEVDFLGEDLGELRIPVTHAPNREAGQANYTSLLHLGPLASRFQQQNLTGKWLGLRRRPGGGYTLSIRDTAP